MRPSGRKRREGEAAPADAPAPTYAELRWTVQHEQFWHEADPDLDRRRSDRFNTDVPVRFRLPGTRARRTGRTCDIGERGVCIHVRDEIEVGEKLELDIEMIMPTRVRLGFDMNALMIDGPAVTHHVRVPGIVRRSRKTTSGLYELGIELTEENCDAEQLHVVDLFLDHLRDGGASIYR